MSNYFHEPESVESRLGDLDDLYNIINYYDYELNVYTEALFTIGLDKNDIEPLENILDYLMNLEFNIKEKYNWDKHMRHKFAERYVAYPYFRIMWPKEDREIYQKWDNIMRYERKLLKFLGSIEIGFYKILTELKKQYKKPNFNDFIKSEASLLHLVSTNNHKFANIKKYSDDAYLFCCQFHEDRTPSMRVNAHNKKFNCYACGMSGDVIQYIMQFEGLDRYHALALLAAIYKIEFRNNPYNEESELVKKYTNYYALSKYKKRLDTGYKRAKKKKKNFNNYLALKNYEREYALIDRIKHGEYIRHDKKTENKKLVYEIPDFE